jgi:hypothetical protein
LPPAAGALAAATPDMLSSSLPTWISNSAYIEHTNSQNSPAGQNGVWA